MGRLEAIMRQVDYVWEDLIYDQCTKLPTLMDVDLIDARWLPYLKPLLGFTDDLSFAATTEELRRILNRAVPYWNEKPTELGVIKNAIRMVTGNRFRIANWFDFRMQEDKTCITEELGDFDPYAIGFLSLKLSGTEGVLGELGLLYFSLGDLTKDGAAYNFVNPHDFRWLSIDSDPAEPTNEGIYEIDYVIADTKTGYLKADNPFAVAHAGLVEYRIWGHMEEYISEVRLVDNGLGTLHLKNVTSAFGVSEKVVGTTSGASAFITAISGDSLTLRSIFGRFEANEPVTDTGGGAGTVKDMADVLNRELIDFLMGGRTVKPFSERIDIVYINFLDQFHVPGDLDQWEVNDPDVVSILTPAGPCRLLQAGRIQSIDTAQIYWGDQVTAWKITPLDDTTIVYLTFMGTDANNSYYVIMNYSAKTVELWKVVAGTPTQLGSTVSLSYLKVDVQDVVRVDALAEGSDTRIRVKVNGETEIDVADSPASYTAGRVGAYAVTDRVDIQLVEVNVLPSEIQRVGPVV